MRIFITGAAGFIGSTVTAELIQAGHQVLGLARNDANAQQLTAAGAQVHPGDLENLESLRTGAAAADAVIHLGFVHDFSRFREVCEIDRRAVETMGETLAGSGRMMIVTSGTAMSASAPGAPSTETDPPVPSTIIPRAATEEAAMSFNARGVRVAVVRLPQVHDTLKQGLITYVVQVARAKGVSAYIGEGQNRWPAAHRIDAAHLYHLALEKGEGNVRYHPVAEEGVPLRDIAEVIGKGLSVPVVSLAPEQAAEHFGWLAPFASRDIPASSALTRQKLGWTPTGPKLLTDLQNMQY